MNEIQLFGKPEFGNIRVIAINGEPWFVANDIERVLELTNIRQNLASLEDVEKGVYDIYTQGGTNQSVNIVNESGLYALIFKSRLQRAKEFRKWVTSEVIPSIRKTGMYINPQAVISPQYLRQLADAMEAKDKKISALTAQIERNAPKVGYCDSILQCKELVSTTKIAKDYGFSGRAFNRLLHELGVQFKQGDIWLLYQKYSSLGWTQTKTHVYTDKSGQEHCRVHNYWTQKGRLGLYKLLKENGYLPLIEQ